MMELGNGSFEAATTAIEVEDWELVRRALVTNQLVQALVVAAFATDSLDFDVEDVVVGCCCMDAGCFCIHHHDLHGHYRGSFCFILGYCTCSGTDFGNDAAAGQLSHLGCQRTIFVVPFANQSTELCFIDDIIGHFVGSEGSYPSLALHQCGAVDGELSFVMNYFVETV